MARFAAVLVLLVTSAMSSPADVTPRGPDPPVGSSVVVGGAYTVELFGVQANRDGTIRAYVRITKKDPVHGALVLEQSIAIGDPLGVTGDAKGARLSGLSPQLLSLLKGDPPVEFDPKAKLLSAAQHSEWPIKVCILVKTADGWGCVDLEKRRVAVPVNEIVVQDQAGKKLTLRNSRPPGRMPSDQVCTVHGGRISARLLTEEEKQEVRAVFQLDAADQDWRSMNPKVRRTAQETYAKLLKEFASTSVVRKSEDRIKSRAEAEIED